MHIEKIDTISDYGIFRRWQWPTALPVFRRYNVIYGWNGSGKTTLSRLFRHLQSIEPHAPEGIRFVLSDGRRVSTDVRSDTALPTVRVFNSDFVSETITSVNQGNVPPIHYIGDSATQRVAVDTRKSLYREARVSLAQTEKRHGDAYRALDKFRIQQAKTIKTALLGSEIHANYDKKSFSSVAEKFIGLEALPERLTEDQTSRYRARTTQESKERIEPAAVNDSAISDMWQVAQNLLAESVVANVIDDLAADVAVNRWVQMGWELHRGDRNTDTCRFCGGEFTNTRRGELEVHFSDELVRVQQNIDQTIAGVDKVLARMRATRLPEKSEFYADLTDDGVQSVMAARKAIDVVGSGLEKLREALLARKDTVFMPGLKLSIAGLEAEALESLREGIDSVNHVVAVHNAQTSELEERRRDAYAALEVDLVVGLWQTYMELKASDAKARMGLIRFGGHLPKGEYDVDHDGHEGQADAAELHG